MTDEIKPIKIFQPFSSEARAMHAASFRLHHRQKEALGQSFWIHPLRPGIAFQTRAAAKAALAQEVES